MSPPAPPARPLLRLERVSLLLGALALVASALLGWIVPHAIGAAYRLAAFACLAVALGSLLFQLIHRLTGGQWGPALQPFLTAGTALLPWTWLITLPLLFFPGQELLEHPDHPDLYASHPMVLLRAVLYGVVFWLLAAGLARVRRRRAAGDFVSLRWIAPAGLIGLVFMLHLLAEDWLIALDPGWHSTAFPIVWVVGQALAGLACAVVCVVLAGANPAQPGASSRALGLDWGNLLLASTMFFTYVAFAQFLIVWAGNLPHEISWYRLRTDGAWLWVIVGLAIFHFAVPFLALLSRRAKRRAASLAAIALLLLAAQLVYLAWLILPVFRPFAPLSSALAVTLPLAALGFFLNRYLAAARRFAPVPS